MLQALSEAGGWALENIHVYDKPENLVGYQGDKRAEVAHVIIRKNFVGSASNDIGFVKKENGTYEAIISQYDKNRYNEKWVNKLKQSYAFHSVRIQQESRGRTVNRERLENGKQRITIRGYR